MEQEMSFLSIINNQFQVSGENPGSYSPLTLAFIGDSIYGLVVKTYIVEKANCPANVLNSRTTRYVKATAQSAIAQHFIAEGILSENEQYIYTRGRNAKASSTAKNASVQDYRKATGLEALIGYLYLSGENERMVELIGLGISYIDEIFRQNHEG